jgi:uncharacterized metal-binding protein
MGHQGAITVVVIIDKNYKHMNSKKPIYLVFSCSGVADVGEMTDMAARRMNREGMATMSCLASIAAAEPGITFNAQIASKILVIDGCPKKCASTTFHKAGFTRFAQFDLSEIGMLKGKSAPTNERVQEVMRHGVAMLKGD